MPLPSEFSEVEHLQATIRRYLNKQVREDFRDLGDEFWDSEVITTRGSMRHALTHKDEDPLNVTLLRMFLYYFTYGKAKQMQPDIFGAPIVTVDRQRKYKPQITLHFNNKGYNPQQKQELVEGEISFRLMSETSTTLTKTELERYANKIKTLFAGSTPFVWRKGKKLVSYTDWEKGYQLQLLITSEAEAKRVVEQVLDIQGHTPDWKNLNTKTNSEESEAYSNNPGNQTILGKSREKTKCRPVVDVKFRYATIAIHGLNRAITLIDTTYTRSNPLVKAS